MLQFSVVIPFHAADQYRLDNLYSVLAYYRKHFPNAKIIVAEQDQQSQLANCDEIKECSHLFVEDSGPFNKSRMINQAVAEVSTELIVITDSDLILEPKYLERTIAATQKQFEFARPYESWVDLNLEQTLLYFNTAELPAAVAASEAQNRNHLGEKFGFAAGIFVVRKDIFDRLGGFDERFSGWGGEDDAFALSLRLNKVKIGVIHHSNAWHLWHPRARGDGPLKFGGDNHEILESLYEKAYQQLKTGEDH